MVCLVGRESRESLPIFPRPQIAEGQTSECLCGRDSGWGTEKEEREEEVGAGGRDGGDMRREKREMIRNKSWEAHKCSLVSVVDPVTDAEGWVMFAGIR